MRVVCQQSFARMKRLRCIPDSLPGPKVRVVDDSSAEVGEWIPTRQEFIQVYKDVGMIRDDPLIISLISRVKQPRRHEIIKQPEVGDIIPTSRKIGKRTFVEDCFDAILLLACRAGVVLVVSYLLTCYHGATYNTSASTC